MNVQSSAFCVRRSTRTKLSIDFCVELWYDPAARDIVSAESSPVMSQLTRDASRQGHAGAPSPTSSLHDVHLDTAIYRLNQLIRYYTDTNLRRVAALLSRIFGGSRHCESKSASRCALLKFRKGPSYESRLCKRSYLRHQTRHGNFDSNASESCLLLL